VVAIVALLIGILVPALGMAREQARMVIELSAARNLMLGHMMYAGDHRGVLIPGYDIKATAQGPDGEALSFPETARYPWRLVPYLDGEIEQTVLVHQRADEVYDDGGELNTYGVSVMPSFGINGEFVGGTWGGPYNNWLTGVGVTVTRVTEALKPAELIVFGSARGGVSGTDPVLGFHMIQPAYGAEYHEEDAPATFGHVHPRYDGKAVISFLDGHAGTLIPGELQDMTYWSDAAARQNNSNWTLHNAIDE